MANIYEKYKDYTVKPKTQAILNKPLNDATGFNEGQEGFLQMLIKQLESKKLNPDNPDTLYNHAIFDKLPEAEQEKASLTAINLMSMIRQIEGLYKLDKSATFQIQNLVETVFQMKSRFEKEHGDVYVI